jgi:Tfp pilus assembly protein PilX
MGRARDAEPIAEPTRGARLRAVIRRRFAGEDGIALVLTLIVMGVLTIGTAAVITEVNSNEHHFGRDRQVNRALNVAEAGLTAGVASVKALPATATSQPNGSGTVDQGSWSYTASRTQDASDPNLYYWTVTSTGVSPDGNVSRIVSTKVSETITSTSQSQTVTTPASPAYNWGIFLGDATSDCTPGGSTGNVLGGSSGVTVDVYIKGSLCVSGNSSPFILQPTGTTDTLTVYIGNKFKSKSNASPIGTSAAKIHLATIVQGCVDANHGSSPNYQTVLCSKQGSPLNNPNNANYGSGVYATTYSSTQNDIPKPPIDLAWYTNAAPGPGHTCGPGSTFPSPSAPWTATTFKNRVLDNDSARNTSVGDVHLLELVDRSSGAGGVAHNSFDCKSYDSSGTLIGELMWDYPSGGCGSGPTNGVADLTINGTVFIDGNLVFDNCDYAVYQGRGTIYVNGTVTFGNGTKICAKAISGSPCAGNYDPNSNLLEIVAVNAGNASPGYDLSGAAKYEGISYAVGKFNSGNGSDVNGPVIADTATLSGNAKLRTTVNPPPGAPGASSTTTTTVGVDQAAFAGVPGSWQQLK